MKIRDALGNPVGVQGTLGKEDRKVSDSKETSFQGQLRRVENQNAEERIRELVNQVLEQGEKLGKKVDIRDLRIYKKLIAEFLDEAVGNSRKFSKNSFLDRRGRHKVYAVIKKINEELDQLTQDVLNEQKDNLKILQRVDNIKGLILDMVM